MDIFDKAEFALSQHPNVTTIVPKHQFTKGMYIREINVPAGMTFVTELHQTEHPFVILSGILSIWTDCEVPQFIEAPYQGITQPGTRRFVHAHTDVRWQTFHPNPNDERDLTKLHDLIIAPHTNPYLIKEIEE